MQNDEAEKRKVDAAPDEASLTWVEYAIAVWVIAMVVIGVLVLLSFVSQLQGQIFSNITRDF